MFMSGISVYICTIFIRLSYQCNINASSNGFRMFFFTFSALEKSVPTSTLRKIWSQRVPLLQNNCKLKGGKNHQVQAHKHTIAHAPGLPSPHHRLCSKQRQTKGNLKEERRGEFNEGSQGWSETTTRKMMSTLYLKILKMYLGRSQRRLQARDWHFCAAWRNGFQNAQLLGRKKQMWRKSVLLKSDDEGEKK